MKEQKISLVSGTSNSIAFGSNNWATTSTLITTPYGYTNGFVTATHSKSGTPMLTYP
jgi:hypothetical protein